MYLRHTTRKKNGKTHVHWQLVRSVRHGRKGQAFALIEGGQLYKIRMPLPDNSHDPAMPENLEATAREMERQYAGAVDLARNRVTVEGKGIAF